MNEHLNPIHRDILDAFFEQGRVDRVRAEIQAGTYETPAKISATARRIADELEQDGIIVADDEMDIIIEQNERTERYEW